MASMISVCTMPLLKRSTLRTTMVRKQLQRARNGCSCSGDSALTLYNVLQTAATVPFLSASHGTPAVSYSPLRFTLHPTLPQAG
jgi:hypothetical protein